MFQVSVPLIFFFLFLKPTYVHACNSGDSLCLCLLRWSSGEVRGVLEWVSLSPALRLLRWQRVVLLWPSSRYWWFARLKVRGPVVVASTVAKLLSLCYFQRATS